MKKMLVAAVAIIAASPISAETIGPFSSLLVFGDSLSDPGNAAADAGAAWPYTIYPEGQFTNDDSWATKLGADFASGTNFAYGGAKAVEDGDGRPDLQAQIDEFLTTGADVGSDPLTAIWIGGNDFLALPDIPTPQEIEATFSGVIGSISSGVVKLAESGLTDFLVFGLPDFGSLPEHSDDPATAAQLSALTMNYNLSLESSLLSLGSLPPTSKVTFFDVNVLLAEIIGNADILGLNAKDTCLSLLAECLEDPNQFVFYDDIHPTSFVHSRLADEVKLSLAPIPLSGGLGFALGGIVLLGFASRTRKVATDKH